MKKIVGFGDFLVSLSPKGCLRFLQANEFEISYTGAEANVLISLSQMGLPTEFVTRLPDSDIGRCAVASLQKFGVGTGAILFGGDRIGLLYLERGGAQRPSKVIYDRKHSGICETAPDDFDFDRIFADAGWFHLTGITPALSPTTAAAALAACRAARRRGVPISFDLNYRKTLWPPEEARRVMTGIVPMVDLLIANEDHADAVLDVRADDRSAAYRDRCVDAAAKLAARYGVKKVAWTLRTSASASDNDWSAMLWTDGNVFFSRTYHIHVISQIGGGDAFAAGLIYGLVNDFDPQKTIEFAAAASCLKHSIEFDFNLSTVEEITNLVHGDGSGRVLR